MTRDESLRCDRRSFLTQSMFGAGAIALTPGLASATSLLASVGARRDAMQAATTLVVVQLSGGNDGLSTVVPFDDDVYRRLRPNLSRAKARCLPIANGVGLHDGLKGLHALHERGRVATFRAVGYPRPNRSHFESMDIWHSASTDGSAKRSGWLGRVADQIASDDPAAMLNLAERTPLALLGERSAPISFQNPSAFRFAGTKRQGEAFDQIAAASAATDAAPATSARALVERAAEAARRTSERIRVAAAEYKSPVTYARNGLAASLRTTAAMLGSGLSPRVVYTYLGGFDTHAEQPGRHDRLMADLDAALTAFHADLERLGADGRVATMVFSEFGRRVAENGSRGTDHGTAGPVFVVGGRVRGGVHDVDPNLSDLEQGDLRHTIDFRSIYAAVLDGWLSVDARAVLGADHAAPQLFTT